MFTGIIETLGSVSALEMEEGNLHIKIRSSLADQLKIDQSVSHNGVCLTVVDVATPFYSVTAIEETLSKTNLSTLKEEQLVNLERAMIMGSRLDGHMVQGHVDQTGICEKIERKNGSWIFMFTYDASLNHLTIEKGSITVDGVSLTVIDSARSSFSVAIIPYTYENTCFHTYEVGTEVNLEFDVIGKYVSRYMGLKP
ncbi:riboflavin synthase [Eudoraea chungangensis]|uniref:riboflavin synthase n=1 Tax=Eudoraea chungangensis TaxID=1481905 RepID=UPI0023EAC0C5|nr:riboflavin synthase [Eudoraea chungangensis]